MIDKPDYLSHREIEKKACEFAEKYNTDGILPFPVEEIIEFDLEINIIPIPNLQRDLDIEGFTSSDLKSIYVDQFVMENRLYRYRFTLAHELGHIELHADIFRQFPCNSISEWKERYSAIGESDYNWLEWQANCFAGLLLVPTSALKYHFEKALETEEMSKITKIFKKRQITEDSIDCLLEILAGKLVKLFDVSTQVLKIRMEKEKLDIRLLELLEEIKP